MNLPNKITLSRIILTIIIIVILLFPFDTMGISLPSLFINESIVVEIKYLFVGILFAIATISDIIDGKLARKYNMETNIGKVMDDIADKLLIDLVLIVLSTCGFISSSIAIVVIGTDIINYSLKIGCNGNEVKCSPNVKKIKNFLLNIGIVLTLFYNLPFELINFKVSDVMLMISSVLCIVISLQYYETGKKYIKIQ